jgi:hypothetical protein
MNKGGRAGWSVGNTRKRSEMYTEVVLENQKGRDSLDNLEVDGSIILEWILNEIGLEGVRGFDSSVTG